MSTQHAVVPQWSLGWRLQRSLAHAGMSVEQMATELQVSRQTISRWQNDHGAPPKRVYLQAWAALCGVNLEWLQWGVAPTPPGPDDEPGGKITNAYSQPRMPAYAPLPCAA